MSRQNPRTPRPAHTSPILRITRLRTRVQLSAKRLEEIADDCVAAGLKNLAEQIKREAGGMRGAARNV
ncbi:hypothetical protein [Rhodopseudomonas sp.]|uniref:hypothetical protein n=1 Tax=Rhodopseudomonas sp. TaxID=1078 RepID=UPI0039E6548C